MRRAGGFSNPGILQQRGFPRGRFGCGRQMTQLSPIISVVIPVWNGEGTVGRAIDSVLCQKFSGSVEIIAVDDGSNDGTRDELSKYGASIKVITEENLGPAA